MAAARLTSCVAVTSAAVVSMSTFSDRAYADSSFRFPFFSSSPPNAPSPPNQSSDTNSEPPAPEEPNKSGFDPESLERGARALREINSSSYSKQVILFVVLEFNLHYLFWFQRGVTDALCIGKDCSFLILFFVFALQVFDLMRKQEQTRLAELDAERVHYELIQSQGDIVSGVFE